LGWVGVVGITTCYRVDTLGSNRSGARFSRPVRTGPEAHPAFYTVDTGSFLGVEWLGHGVYHPPPSSAEVKERVELYICSPSRPSWLLLG